MELIIIAIGIIVLATFALVATGLGVDSRDLADDPSQPHAIGLA
ncbi:MAG TPA: hypothetical protein VFL03_14055 [Candidatus Limnocylindrales bacterium]|nr:hypothetical protein [Candidatus Limnocylindrales bacterium]